MNTKDSRIDILISDLCDEIDFYKNHCETLQKQYDELFQHTRTTQRKQMEDSQEMIGKMFKGLLDPESLINKGLRNTKL